MSIPAIREPRVIPPAPAAPAPASPAEAPLDRSSPSSPFARLVRGIGHEVQSGEAMVHKAIASARGGELGPAELIALQAGVYRYSEAVDLVSRMVDHATSALKTVIQGQ